MNKIILRIATVFMMLLFGVTAGVYVFMDAEQCYLRSAAEARLAAGDHMETIKVALADCGGKIGDEIWVNGNMYDVSSYEIINDTACVSVYHDNREQELVGTIVDQFDSRDNNIPDNGHHIGKCSTHLTDDGKILNEAFSLTILTAPAASCIDLQSAACPTSIVGIVPTPPPNFPAV